MLYVTLENLGKFLGLRVHYDMAWYGVMCQENLQYMYVEFVIFSGVVELCFLVKFLLYF